MWYNFADDVFDDGDDDDDDDGDGDDDDDDDDDDDVEKKIMVWTALKINCLRLVQKRQTYCFFRGKPTVFFYNVWCSRSGSTHSHV